MDTGPPHTEHLMSSQIAVFIIFQLWFTIARDGGWLKISLYSIIHMFQF